MKAYPADLRPAKDMSHVSFTSPDKLGNRGSRLLQSDGPPVDVSGATTAKVHPGGGNSAMEGKYKFRWRQQSS